MLLKELGEEATYYYHPDHLGSVSVVSNHRGEPYERVEYLPFGEIWIEETDPATGYIPFRFTSKELDEETGLYYYGARYYEPTTSRWMSPDPAGFGLINPMGSDGEPLADGWPEGFGPGQSGGMRKGYSVIEALNWYSYVSNNPVKYVDPTGLKIIIRGDKEFKEKTQAAIDKVRSKPEGKKLVEGLKSSKKRHVIKETEDGNSARGRSSAGYDGGRGSGSTIEFNPDRETGGTDSEGSNERPPFVGLAHELGHAEEYDAGTQSSEEHTFTPGTTPEGEVHSLKRENDVRKEHGLPERPSYYAPKREE